MSPSPRPLSVAAPNGAEHSCASYPASKRSPRRPLRAGQDRQQPEQLPDPGQALQRLENFPGGRCALRLRCLGVEPRAAPRGAPVLLFVDVRGSGSCYLRLLGAALVLPMATITQLWPLTTATQGEKGLVPLGRHRRGYALGPGQKPGARGAALGITHASIRGSVPAARPGRPWTAWHRGRAGSLGWGRNECRGVCARRR